MGDYAISFQDIPTNSTDPAPYNKFQIRLLKRAIDVYLGVGLLQVWNVINGLNASVARRQSRDTVSPDWSFREILRVSLVPADPTTNQYSLYGLAGFIKHTHPLDTDQGAPTTSFRELLSH